MKTTVTRKEYFEVKKPNGDPDFLGVYETAEKALAEINRSYSACKEARFPCDENNRIIVCVRTEIVHDENGNFIKETIARWLTENVQFSEYENKFVFAY